ncbi:hypothetical protein AYI68_g1808 [Smittium mucronatum]|uniref:Uncharacterized protein n=1 Tax=Smittium mucronatum TaxID=133383 RepID=A0A1R0H4G4_9FUNG|nr:hypothetical protein AYI68_g1808 [Smittium mucronatum]
MMKRYHELVESGGCPYWFAPEVDAWREVAEDRNSGASASVSMDALELSGDLDPSVDLVGEPVMEELVSSLLELSLNSDPNPPGAMGEVWIGGVRDDSIFSVAPPLAAQQQFRSEGLYQSNWYRNSASDNIYYLRLQTCIF